MQADNDDDLAKALSLYKQGLNYLVTGVRYTKTERNKQVIREKILEYMDRAEAIDKLLNSKQSKAVVTAEGGAEASSKKGTKAGGGDGDKSDKEEDPENAKLMGALEGAIVKETPNVKWEDVAGLEGAKKLLKEAVILPVKFPQLFVGAIKPWRGILLYGPPGTSSLTVTK